MKEIERIQEIKQLIAKYDRQYYELGQSDISDAEYDRLYEEYLQYEEKYPELKEMQDAPTRRIGAGKEAGSTTLFPKYTHKSPLLSINQKSRDLRDLKDFYEFVGGDGTEVIIEPKLDGITCNVNYENGVFVNAATRGNGYVGDLITENFQNTDTIYPECLRNDISLEVRGEAIIPYDIFKESLQADYSNPRNAVAGIMRSQNSQDVKGKGIQVMFYDIGQYDNIELSDKDSQNVEYLKEIGFGCVPVHLVDTWQDLRGVIESRLNGIIQNIDGFNVLVADGYPQAVCDGLVIKVNSIQKREELGMTEKGPRWAFAYKFKPLYALTTLKDIEWQVGKSGKVVPVAVFDEISLGGVKITKATLNNPDYIQTLPTLYKERTVWRDKSYDTWGELVHIPYQEAISDIDYIMPGDVLIDTHPEKTPSEMDSITVKKIDSERAGFYISDCEYDGEWYPFEKDRYYFADKEYGLHEGDTIIVERSNDVIPRIVAIHHHNTDNPIKIPSTCPVCGHALVQNGPQLFCQNSDCNGQILGKMIQFVSRDGMNIVGLGGSILEVFLEKGYIQTYADIYRLDRYEKDILSLDKFGTRKYQNLQKSVKNSTNPTLSQFLYALGIPLVGKKTAKDLARAYGTLDKFLLTSYQSLIGIDDINSVTASSIMEWLEDKNHKGMIQELKGYVHIQEEKQSSNKLAGKSFVITGTLSNPRDYYVKLIEERGGKSVGSVSKKTYAVLIGENAGSKEKKARELIDKGINIILLDSEKKINEFFEI